MNKGDLATKENKKQGGINILTYADGVITASQSTPVLSFRGLRYPKTNSFYWYFSGYKRYH